MIDPGIVIDPTGVGLLVAGLLGGGGVASLVAFRKAGPEMESVSVTTLRGVIEEMRTELERKDRIIGAQNEKIGQLASQIDNCEKRIHQLEMEPPPHLG